MDNPDNQFNGPSLSISMLISESVYKLVVVIERLVRWLVKAVLRPCLILVHCLRW